MTDLLYSEVEEDLRASVRDLLKDKADAAALLARVETAEGYDLKLWRTLAADLGVAGLAVPEERGGHGASAREVAVVAEELGRSVAPVPFLGSVVLATTALLHTGDREFVGRLAAGSSIGALAVPLSTAPGAGFPSSVTAAADGTLPAGSARSPTRRWRTCWSSRPRARTAPGCTWSRRRRRRCPSWSRST